MLLHKPSSPQRTPVQTPLPTLPFHPRENCPLPNALLPMLPMPCLQEDLPVTHPQQTPLIISPRIRPIFVLCVVLVIVTNAASTVASPATKNVPKTKQPDSTPSRDGCTIVPRIAGGTTRRPLTKGSGRMTLQMPSSLDPATAIPGSVKTLINDIGSAMAPAAPNAYTPVAFPWQSTALVSPTRITATAGQDA